MNKLLLSMIASLLITTTLSAESPNGMYFGFDFLATPTIEADLIVSGTTIGSTETSSKGLKIKLGTKSDNFVYGIHFGYESFDDTMYGSEDTTLKVFGLDLRYGIPMDDAMSLFLKGELDGLQMDTPDTSQYASTIKSFTGVGVSIGFGMSNFITESLEILIGADYQMRTLTSDSSSSTELTIDYTATQIYLGMNFYL